MGIVKRIVCLANSRKLSGRCIAGIEIDDNGNRIGWIRPVSARPTGELLQGQYQYGDGTEVRVLDIVEVPLLYPQAHGYQSENWLIDPTRQWKRVGRLSWHDLYRLVDTPEPLWLDGYHTIQGTNDKVPYSSATHLRTSLRLLYVDRLYLTTIIETSFTGGSRHRLQGRFFYCSQHYSLWITDPVYEQQHIIPHRENRELHRCFITVSLSEPFKGYCYKLIAAIIVPEGGYAQ